MEELELNDIQGIIVRGYELMPEACFVILRINDAQSTKRWLRELADVVRDGRNKPQAPDRCVNIAFTHAGLETLGPTEQALSKFSREFHEGMTTEHRQRILGDHGRSSTEQWLWGGPNSDPVHVLLMLYAPDQAALNELYGGHLEKFKDSGLVELQKLETILLKGRKEHFGFRDGVAQPVILGKDPEAPVTGNAVAAGEFLLGYLNEYGEYPSSPTIAASQDQKGLLPGDANGSGDRDLGRNGSYLVFRQLSQDVRGFWQFLDEQTKGPDNHAGPEARLKLGSKMVGRWPGGAPLVKTPDQDKPELQDDDAFGYHTTDLKGFKCPVGSHIRRTNPRDAFVGDPDESVKLVNRHRMIRRGRAYGRPVDASMDPQKMLEAEDKGGERGLHFLCFNANIARQFEFIQHTWCNNPKFGGLYNDADPIIGDHDPKGQDATGTFTAPAEPVRQRVTGLPRFVEVRGGAYFFMPGIRALRYLATL